MGEERNKEAMVAKPVTEEDIATIREIKKWRGLGGGWNSWDSHGWKEVRERVEEEVIRPMMGEIAKIDGGRGVSITYVPVVVDHSDRKLRYRFEQVESEVPIPRLEDLNVPRIEEYSDAVTRAGITSITPICFLAGSEADMLDSDWNLLITDARELARADSTTRQAIRPSLVVTTRKKEGLMMVRDRVEAVLDLGLERILPSARDKVSQAVKEYWEVSDNLEALVMVYKFMDMNGDNEDLRRKAQEIIERLRGRFDDFSVQGSELGMELYGEAAEVVGCAIDQERGEEVGYLREILESRVGYFVGSLVVEGGLREESAGALRLLATTDPRNGAEIYEVMKLAGVEQQDWTDVGKETKRLMVDYCRYWYTQEGVGVAEAVKKIATGLQDFMFDDEEIPEIVGKAIADLGDADKSREGMAGLEVMMADFGLEAAEMEEMIRCWRSYKIEYNDAPLRQNLIIENLKAMRDIAWKQPGAVAGLHRLYGWKHFGRYPTEMAVDQYVNREQKGSDFGVVVAANSDWNGALHQDIDRWKAMFEKLKEMGVKLKAVEVGGADDIVRKLATVDMLNGLRNIRLSARRWQDMFAGKEQKLAEENIRGRNSFSFVIWAAHGIEQGMEFDTDDDGRGFVTVQDLYDLAETSLKGIGEEKRTGIFHSCRAGVKNGPAQTLSRVKGWRTIGPDFDSEGFKRVLVIKKKRRELWWGIIGWKDIKTNNREILKSYVRGREEKPLEMKDRQEEKVELWQQGEEDD